MNISRVCDSGDNNDVSIKVCDSGDIRGYTCNDVSIKVCDSGDIMR